MSEKSSLDEFNDSIDEKLVSNIGIERIAQLVYNGHLSNGFLTFSKKFMVLAYNHTTEQSKSYDLSIWWSKKGKLEYGYTAFSSCIQGIHVPTLTVEHVENTTYQFVFKILAHVNITDNTKWSFKATELSSISI